jgi:hypothetical protein
MRSTTFVSRVKEKTAAAVMLTRPARPVASRMEMRIGSMCRPLVIWDVENLLRVAVLAGAPSLAMLATVFEVP